MPQPIVFIIFNCRSGSTEKLALAAAVGAVQGRALIRLRRLPDADSSGTTEDASLIKETLQRMHREYVAPTETDVLKADALILAPPPDSSPTSAEWAGHFELLARLARNGKLAGKVAAVVDSGDQSTLQSFAAALGSLGLHFVPNASQEATSLGRTVAAETMKLMIDSKGR